MKKRIKSTVSLLLVSSLLLTACGNAEPAASTEETAAVETAAPESSAAPEAVVVDLDGTVLRPFVLTPGFSGDKQINFIDVADDALVGVLNPATMNYEAAELTEAVIKGNFVCLADSNEDEVADIVKVINYNDADSVWDASMAWVEGAGDVEPYVSDELGCEVFGAESVVPYGERLLSEFGIEEWSATVDFENAPTSTYWSDNDYYNTLSGETLTILPQYKTRLQPTGWTCGLSSIVTVLDWFGLRGNLNEFDLSTLRGMERWGGGTDLDQEMTVFQNLTALGLTPAWNITSSHDDPYLFGDPEWLDAELAAGHPILVVWNAYGWHWQVIIGHDTMGTEDTLDDVLIMMDPYDTTDQHANGYELESYERLFYGVSPLRDGTYTSTLYFSVYPEGWSYEQKMGSGIAPDMANVATFTDDNKLSYANTAADIQKYYPDTEYLGDNGLAGPAEEGYERSGDHDNSPYWKTFDFYNMESNDSLRILTNFQTLQQSTEWTCGLASARMVMNWFGMAEKETDVSLGSHRQDGKAGATRLTGMQEVFTYMNDTYNQDWVWISTEDLDDPDGEESYIGDYCLQAATYPEWYGLIPYLLEHNIPIMIGSDEWGGHWQVIIGYDDMGTIEKSEDDIIILADPYDTTDHNQDGYLIDGFERLVYGWGAAFEDVFKHNDFIAAFPASKYADVMEELGIN